MRAEQGGVREGINTSALAMIAHALLMVTPNILNPRKLARNVRHPVHEVLHTKHNQYPLESEGMYVVEHELFGRLVTLDVVKQSAFAKGLIPRVKQLFREDFYYGHADYFPLPFELVDRTYMSGEVFDYAKHIQGVMDRQKTT